MILVLKLFAVTSDILTAAKYYTYGSKVLYLRQLSTILTAAKCYSKIKALFSLFCRSVWQSRLKSVILQHENSLKSVVFGCQKLLKSVSSYVVQEDYIIHRAQELRAHGHKLFYYDNRKQGEVDYLVDNHTTMSAHPIEVKSGKDYTEHSALNNLLKNPEYNVVAATVISNEREIRQDGKVTYMPVYFVMFMEADASRTDEEYIF